MPTQQNAAGGAGKPSYEQLVQELERTRRKLQQEVKAHDELKIRFNELKIRFNETTEDSLRRNNMDHMLLDVLDGERALATKLLQTLVPPRIAADLSQGIAVPPEMYRFAIVFFSDIEGFTSFGDSRPAIEVFNMLDRLFGVMDSVVTCFPALYKVETIGDGK